MGDIAQRRRRGGRSVVSRSAFFFCSCFSFYFFIFSQKFFHVFSLFLFFQFFHFLFFFHFFNFFVFSFFLFVSFFSFFSFFPIFHFFNFSYFPFFQFSHFFRFSFFHFSIFSFSFYHFFFFSIFPFFWFFLKKILFSSNFCFGPWTTSGREKPRRSSRTGCGRDGVGQIAGQRSCAQVGPDSSQRPLRFRGACCPRWLRWCRAREDWDETSRLKRFFLMRSGANHEVCCLQRRPA